MSISKEVKYLSARQAAEKLGVSKAYACRLFARNVIPAMKVDCDWIVAEKDIRTYLDNKENIPLYYRNSDDWDRDDHYLLFRTLDHMLSNRKDRYRDELEAIDISRLGHSARAFLVAFGAPEKYASMSSLTCDTPLCPPVVLSDYPTPGKNPAFERLGIIL